MLKYVQDVGKSALTFFAVGVALAFAAPVIADTLGPSLIGQAALNHAIDTPILWTGVFFGMFGGIHTAVSPLLNRMFGSSEASTEKECCKELEKAKEVTVSREQTQEIAPAVSGNKSHVAALQTERNQPHMVTR